MNRKITLFAFGVNMGGLAASGFVKGVPVAACVCRAKNSPSRRLESARPVNDAPASQKNSRRVRRQNDPWGDAGVGVMAGLVGWDAVSGGISRDR